jgi:hypothetical protein
MENKMLRVRLNHHNCEIHLETDTPAMWRLVPTPPRFKHWQLSDMYVCNGCIEKYGLMLEAL